MFEEFTDSEPLRIYPTKGEPIEQPPPTPVYSGSGRVTDCRGNGISDATVTLGGSAMAVTTTDAAGNYAFAGLPAGGGYNLSPSKADQYLRFSTEVTNLNGNQTVNLTLIPQEQVRAVDGGGATPLPPAPRRPRRA